jgi:hypothetical protein
MIGLATPLGTGPKKPRALIMSVFRELDIAVSRDAEMLHDPSLKFVFEDLAVAVDNEPTLHEVDHDASTRPFLVFGFTYDGGESVRGASCSPTFPEVVVAAWAGEAVSISLSVG